MQQHQHNFGGSDYWRSLAELAESPEIAAALEREFPGYDPGALVGTSRRKFLKLMAASMALAGLTLGGCRRWPEREVAPHNAQPEGVAPGQRLSYATMMELGGVATGLLVTAVDGRPIKVDGNPLHPYSLGAADVWAQASVLELYDPDRSRQVVRVMQRENGRPELRRRSWEEFYNSAHRHFDAMRQTGGGGLAVLSQPTSSPTLLRLRAEFLRTYPQSKWYCYEPLHRDHEIAGSRQAFGKALRLVYDLKQARIIACFDADLLSAHPAHQRHARDWSAGRIGEAGEMNRLYAAESAFTLTGSVADHRLPVRPSRVGVLLAAVVAAVADEPMPDLTESEAAWTQHLASDLKQHPGESLIAVGPQQPPQGHALAHRLNTALGNSGRAVRYVEEPRCGEASCIEAIHRLGEAIRAGEVHTLLILGGNPVYDAPADAGFDLVGPNGRPVSAIHIGLHFNETSARCAWHLPMAHYLECWGDGRAWDGTYSVQQPLILPLFGGRSPAELMAALLRLPETDGRELVRQTLRQLAGDGDFEGRWEKVLHDGVMEGSAWPAVDVSLENRRLEIVDREPIAAEGEFEVVFAPDASLYDGRFANNGWLQEMPDPLTKLTWDNAALISAEDAGKIDATTGDMIAVTVGPRTMELPAYVMPGAAPGVIVLPLGYGRTAAGRIGNRVGFDAYRLRSGDGYRIDGATITRTGRRYRLAMTQEHHLIDAVGMWGREKRVGAQGESGYVIREATLAAFAANPKLFRKGKTISLQLYDPPSEFNTPHAWGMAIDLSRCIGCNACVIACQAENNIPIVGKQEVAKHREMHWLRIDRYFKGPVVRPDVVHMPMACLHCENAPCEQVCPVAATVHDSEGLNTMVYNRCIGTRYCANNCPVKVRRFNYFDYHSSDPRARPRPWLGIPDQQQLRQVEELRRMQFNPEVTVRMRGVMEKCTYCTQKIQAAKISARVEHANGRRESDLVQDHEAMPACASACPTQAIAFGDLNDPASVVSQWQRNNRAYDVLEELNLRGRTRYLGKLRNPATSRDRKHKGAGPAQPVSSGLQSSSGRQEAQA